jgi:hypothetical protein
MLQFSKYISYSIIMSVEDSYTLSNLIYCRYHNHSPFTYSNAEYMLRYVTEQHLLKLGIAVTNGTYEVYGVPKSSMDTPFPYTTKELLAYLYDKIESN